MLPVMDNQGRWQLPIPPAAPAKSKQEDPRGSVEWVIQQGHINS
jgi:hypothetical protein